MSAWKKEDGEVQSGDDDKEEKVQDDEDNIEE